MKNKNQTKDDLVNSVKKKINVDRLNIQDEKSKVDALGEITKTVEPEDIIAMYTGKLCVMLIKNKVRAMNIKSGYLRAYKGRITPQLKETLDSLEDMFNKDFESTKDHISKYLRKHDLWKRMGFIRGLSEYQLALIMAYVKDIEKFDTPSKLCVYSGMASINNIPVTKANIEKIKKLYFDEGKEFKGFNTEMSGRVLVLVDCLLRAQGYFTNMYQKMRIRLEKRKINEGGTYISTEKDVEESKVDGIPKMTLGRHYIKDRKNQSLEAWSDANAKRRVARTFLHLMWTEWRLLKDLPVRNPYPIDYLGHNELISIDDIKQYEKNIVIKRPRKTKTDK